MVQLEGQVEEAGILLGTAKLREIMPRITQQ